jgi:hypothetical protein
MGHRFRYGSDELVIRELEFLQGSEIGKVISGNLAGERVAC